MLNEAHELKRSGVDIVIGYFEPHGRKDTMALIEGLEVVPQAGRRVSRDRASKRWTPTPILRRRPQVAVVDEFPHTNVPGSPGPKRWEDVHVLLDAGIDVLTTMNVQHVESLNDQIWQSTGVRVRETIPDWVVKQADEVVMVDLTPRALLNRLERGVVYPPDRARAALQNFFREPTLVALRELAMRQTAYAVETRHPPEEKEPPRPRPRRPPTPPNDRLLLVIEPNPGERRADSPRSTRGRLSPGGLPWQSTCRKTADLRDLSEEERDHLQRQLNFARGLQIETRVLTGDDIAETLVTFARQEKVTQIFVVRQKERTLRTWFTEGLVQRIVNLAQDMQVTVVADRSTRPAAPEGRAAPAALRG